MSTPVVIGGNTYNNPAYGDSGWAQGSGSLPQIITALAAAVLSTPAFMQTVSVAASPQAVTQGKTYLTSTSAGAITFNLPAPAVNMWFMIKDVSGLAGTNNMTLHRNGTELIDGVASDKTCSLPSELLVVASDGTNWFVLLEI